MSSLKMTFSLTSLIFLIALGLVFVPTSVIAHDNTGEGDTHAKAGHMHPKVTISAADADASMAGIQVVQKADSDTNPLTLEFDAKITLPAVVTQGDGTTPIGDGSVGSSDLDVVSHNPDYDPVGTVVIGSITRSDLMFNVPLTLTLVDPAATSTAATKKKAVDDAIKAGLKIKVTVNAGIIKSSKVGGPYKDQWNVEQTETFTVVSKAFTAPPTRDDPPYFPSGASIDDIIIWKGHAFTTANPLPKARSVEGQSIAYEIEPTLPDGFKLVHDDSQDRFIEVREADKGMTMVMKQTAYKFIATSGTGAEKVKSEPVTFKITVLAPKKPTAPTMVMAMENGAMADNTMRTVNDNRVVVNWKAPVDATMTSHDPAIPFGAPITGYMVYQTDADDMETSYPLSGAPMIKKDATSYKTPMVTPNGVYGFKVAAMNSVGTGAKSDPAAEVTVADVPGAPTDLNHSKDPAGEAITLSWKAATGADPNAPVTAHTVYITTHAEEDVATEEAGAGTSHQIETSLDAGSYVFRVSATNLDGKGEKSDSARFEVEVPTTADNQGPTFGDATIAAIMATEDMAITGVTLPAATDPDGDDSAIKYTLSPRLPAGLSFNKSTRFLSGTPTAAKVRTTYTYTATDSRGKSASLSFEIQVTGTPAPIPTGDLNATYANMKTTITSGMLAADSFATIGASHLPDLEEFFDVGGTINLSNGDTTVDKNSRVVVISEILWGLDFGAPAEAQTQWQFIELYNTTGGSINLAGWTLTFTEGNVRGTIDIDQVSNRGPGGWEVDTGDTGQSGRVTGTTARDLTSAITPTSIISMYRNINYAKVQKTHDANNATENRKKQLDGFPAGNAKGSWKASQRRSTYERWIYDSKRAKHHTTTGILVASTVAGTPFRINEIGNDTDGANDWVELHNLTDSVQSLKNYALSMVTAKGTDTRLFHFHDQDWKIPAKGYVVISTRHPRDTDLAAGKDISIADDQEENKGAKHLFVVKSGWNLKDDGKFALILRNAHDKQGKAEALIDVVATRQGAFADTNTSLWPLKVTGLPHGNVIDGGDENFAAGKVYQRNSGNGRGEKHLAVRGSTGVGYDRAAEASGANGGTPGYDNGAIKDKIMDGTTVVFDGDITFSEIMLGLGDGRQNLPQWIELYNNSMMQAVNLNGWKLHVENTADVKTALDAVLTLDSMIIPPNQTVLIVTNTGRVSDSDHFPSNRVLNLWTTKKHRDALQMVRRTDQVFSTTGLYLKLADTKGNTVDEVGNLDGNRRTRDELDDTWTIPMNGDDDGRRSSLIRVYDDNVAVKGTMEEAWVLADETDLAYAISETYYGDPDDFGTPGFRGGGPLPVSLSKFRPERTKDTGEVVVRWVTESELNNAGFNILRSEKRDGEFTKVHYVAGKGTTSERSFYEWKDTSAKPNVVYYYQIQDISLDGKVTTLRITHLRGNVTAAGKATTTWGEIKALQ